MALETVACPACGARNAPAVPWCGQCYTPSTPAHGDGEESTEKVVAAAIAAVEERPGAPSVWECRFCGTENPLSESECGECYRSIFDTFGEGRRQTVDVDPRDTIGWSIAFPGLGFAKVGMIPHAVVVGLLAFFCLGTGIVAWIVGLPLHASLLLLTALGLWLVAGRDVLAVAAGHADQIWLRMRVLTIVALAAATLAGLAMGEAIGELRDLV